MANIAKRDFDILDVSGAKYLQWKDDIISHLGAMGLEHTTQENIWSSYQDKQKAHIFIRHHLTKSLKNEYLKIRDPYELLQRLEDRFGHHKDVILLRLRDEWRNLRFQDYTSVNEYNSALFRLSSQLEYCGDKISDDAKIVKTFSTMGTPNLTFQRVLRQNKYTKFTDLITELLVSDQHDNVLLKNDSQRPSGSVAIPGANNVAKFGQNNGHGRGRGPGRGRGYGPGRGQNNFKRSRPGKQIIDPVKFKPKGVCHKCGLTGHWASMCRTNKHFVDLYQASK